MIHSGDSLVLHVTALGIAFGAMLTLLVLIWPTRFSTRIPFVWPSRTEKRKGLAARSAPMTFKRILGCVMVTLSVLSLAILGAAIFGPDGMSNRLILSFGMPGALLSVFASIVFLTEGGRLFETRSQDEQSSPPADTHD